MKHGRLAAIRPFIISSPLDRTPFLPLEHTLSVTQGYISHLTSNSLSYALQHYINSDNPFYGLKIHTHLLKTGFKPNTNISIKLLILHLKCGSLRYARQMFDELPHPTLSAYNYIIGGFLRQGQVEESLGLVRRMVLSGEKPDGFTFSMMLKASTCASYVQSPYNLGKIVHAQIIKSDVSPDEVLYTALVASYVKSGKLGYARTVFDLMLERNVVCSTSLITGYMNQGSLDDAEEIFSRTVYKDIVVFNAMIEGYSKWVEHASKSIDIYIEMQRLNFRPNISTFASVIGACSMLTAFEVAQQVQSQLMKTEFFTHIKMGSALIDMYSKCGKIEDARKIFDHMPEKNVFSWTSMIDGYGKNGYPYEALQLFSIMQDHFHIEPNFVTFLSALTACAHAGLVDKGLEIFESMERDYFLKPKMEHYACVVDLLGRAGSLNKAWEFVKAIPETPNSDVWAALLSSSRLHGYVELASIAANELFKLNANDRPGAYIALSNTLAAAGKWDSVGELREKMKVRGISKDTGRSWVAADFSL